MAPPEPINTLNMSVERNELGRPSPKPGTGSDPGVQRTVGQAEDHDADDQQHDLRMEIEGSGRPQRDDDGRRGDRTENHGHALVVTVGAWPCRSHEICRLSPRSSAVIENGMQGNAVATRVRFAAAPWGACRFPLDLAVCKPEIRLAGDRVEYVMVVVDAANVSVVDFPGQPD